MLSHLPPMTTYANPDLRPIKSLGCGVTAAVVTDETE